ncbi:unnamed protein product [Amoebophrya sp. A25]|nr:unnamed protein product [Amoebophrya sp. A25]|eukprot:GSA25T00024170001.1
MRRRSSNKMPSVNAGANPGHPVPGSSGRGGGPEVVSDVPMSEEEKREKAHQESPVIRILIFTDTHLGYKDTDPVLENDAMDTFEEMLNLAKTNKVDMILHSGDLFDENRPSRNTMFRTFNLMSTYLFGDRTIPISVTHVDEHANLAAADINFYNPNYNVSIPMFMIHGNHDDPGGMHKLSANDELSANCLVNYFGRQEDVEDIKIGAICIEKNGTRIALYGLGNVRDERLNRAFEQDRVRWIRPDEAEDVRAGKSRYFNIFLIHQNRFKGNFGGVPNKQCVREESLPEWLDLVIWGHEHECKVDPVESLAGYHLIQPGSSVATSLIPAEAVPKQVLYMELKGTQYKTLKSPLTSVRPFKLDEVRLDEYLSDPTDQKQIWDRLTQHVQALIDLNAEEQAQKMDENMRSDKLPLVRLRVNYTDFPCYVIGNNRFGQQFVDKVANPDSVLYFFKKTSKPKKKVPALDENGNAKLDEFGEVIYEDDDQQAEQDPAAAEINLLTREQQRRSMAETLAGLMPKVELDLFSQGDLMEAVTQYVEKGDAGSIERYVRATIESTNEQLLALPTETTTTDPNDILMAFKHKREQIRNDVKTKLANPDYVAESGNASGVPRFEDDPLDDPMDEPVQPARGKAKAKAKGRAKAKGKAKAKAPSASSSPSDHNVQQSFQPQNRGGFLGMQMPPQQQPASGASSSSMAGGGMQMGSSYQNQGLQPPPKRQRTDDSQFGGGGSQFGGGGSQFQQQGFQQHGGMGGNLPPHQHQSQINRNTQGGAVRGPGGTQSQRTKKLPWQ